MSYGQFITEIQKYWALRKKGLKNRQTVFFLINRGQSHSEVKWMQYL